MIDWDLFARRVKAGARVRQLSINDTVIWDGFLLENYPYQKEEFLMDRWAQETARYALDRLNARPVMRYQRFESLFEGYFPLKLDGIEFLIDGTWLSFQDVMGDGE